MTRVKLFVPKMSQPNLDFDNELWTVILFHYVCLRVRGVARPEVSSRRVLPSGTQSLHITSSWAVSHWSGQPSATSCWEYFLACA